MKTNRQYHLIFLLFLFSFCSEAKEDSNKSNKDPVVIYSVSTRLGAANTVPSGSAEGGTTIYMKVSGLDQTASNNAVYVGKYPCIIPDKGVNGLFINCMTTKADTHQKNLSKLPIVIQVAGKSDSTCTFSSSYCYFTYQITQTPTLYYATPRSSFPKTINYWRAQFTVPTNEQGNLDGQYMGKNRCDRSKIKDDYADEINQWDDIVACQVSSDIEAGTYSYKIKSVNGHQKNDFGVSQKNIQDDNSYESKIHPLITSLNSNSISPEGKIIQVNGCGFSKNVEKNEIKVSGQSEKIKVLSSTGNQLTALIPPYVEIAQTIFIQGSGLKYTRYDLSGTTWNGKCSNFRTQLKTAPDQLDSKIVFDGIYSEPDVQNTFGSNYGEYFRGFIKAPKTGNYKFYVASDDCAQVYLQSTPLSTDQATMVNVATTGWSPYRNYWYQQLLYPTAVPNSISDAIALTQDEYYYIEIIHTNGGGTGYVTASLEIESDTLAVNSISDLYSITTSYVPVHEIIEILVYNSAMNTPLTGTYKLNFAYGMTSTTGLKYSYTTGDIDASATETTMRNAINYCGGSYQTSVVRSKVDTSGTELDSAAVNYAGWKYVVTFEAYRGTTNYRAIPTITGSTLNGGKLVKSITRKQEPADPISGTFQLAVEDSEGNDDIFYYTSGSTQVFDLTFDTSTSIIADNIQRITEVRPIVWTEGRAQDGIIWRIQLRGVQSLNNFKILSNNLRSGNGNPDIILETTLTHSNNMLFQPIPSELLYTYASVPQIQVSVNGILGGCEKHGACDLIQADDMTPIIKEFTRNNDQLSIKLESGSGLQTLKKDKLSITYAGVECSDIKLTDSTPYTITCKVESRNGKVVLEAGDQVPKVHYEHIGFSKTDEAATAELIQLNISAINPSLGSPDGLTEITITGTGFPSDQSKNIILTIGGTSVTPVSVSNTQIIVIAPARVGSENNVDIVINFNGKSVTSQLFSYDDSSRMEISNLEYTNKGPTFKGTITIGGTNFGTDKSKLTVNLKNENKNYECPVVSVSDTSITVYLRGGMPGDYRFIIIKSGFGGSFSQNNANQFSYITLVTSVLGADGSPAVGSEAGGTRLKITGENFVPEETIVFIGPKVNQICVLDETASSTTTLYCTTPPKHESYYGPQEVVVTTRVTLESVCDNGANCSFEFQSALTPSLVSYPTDIVPITGTRLLSEQDHQKPDYQKTISRKRFLWTEESKKKGHNHLLNFGQSSRRDLLSADELVLTQFKTYLSGDTETLTSTGVTGPVKVIFKGTTTTEIDATFDSDLGTIVYTIPNLTQGDYATYILTATGYADKIWITRIDLTVSAVTPQSIVQGGQTIEINGGGFNANSNIAVKVNSVLCTHLHVISSVQLECKTPRTTSTGSKSVAVSQIDLSKSNEPIITVTTSVTVLAASGTPLATTLSGNDNLSFQTVPNSNVFVGDSSSFQFIINGSGLDGTTAKVFIEYKDRSYEGTIVSKSESQVEVSFTNVPQGTYLVQYSIDNKFAFFSNLNQQNLQVQGSAPTTTNPQTSYAGGKIITFTGTGFDTDTKYSKVSVCGFDCPITSATFTTLNCEAPIFPSPSVLGQYTALQESPRYISPSEITISSDTAGALNAVKFFDQLQTTYYDSTAATDCYVILDLGSDRELKLQQFRYAPRIDVLANYLKDAVFQYSTDGTTFTNFLVVDQTVHTGWNIYVPASPIEHIKKIKFTDTRGTTGSKCQLADIEIKGWIISGSTNLYSAPTICTAQVEVNGFKLATIASATTYSSASTPTVTTVTPADGLASVETEITITGTGFVDGSTTVTVDGITCVLSSVSTTQIVCTTGTKDSSTNLKNGEFQVRVDGNLAVNNQIFRYANRWSNIATWGGYVFPSDGDSVIVNQGETLIVDQITPKLMQILVEGELTFADEGPTTLDAHYIVIREGKFTIGTESVPHENQVTITLRGVEEDTQMPSMGNKVLGCHQCTLDIHGKVRTPTWTLLSSTVEAGDVSITVDDPIDWVAGESIVIASSESDHLQSEVRTIVSVTGQTITLDQPLKFRHYSAVETYGADSFPMKVEVGLLTRNIVIQGEQSENNYGGHLMINGQSRFGAIGRISYTEFKQVGQPTIIGRYPIYFNLNGEVDESFVRGNSIHDSYARCIALRGVHNLKIQKNVCYNTSGHAIFMEDGTETNNIIEGNLVTTVKANWILLQSDITCAAYWITNPQNFIRGNRSGGSEWYGFLYEIMTNPDGPSATSNICPPGLNVLEFSDNWSHSNSRYGLRISDLVPRQYPCIAYRDDTKEDPFITNPSLQGIFQRFWTWKNDECGILGNSLGNILFKDIMIADSKLSGFQAHQANYSREGITLQDTLIIGKSNGNAAADEFYDGSRGIIVPRTNGFLAKNIKLYNFGANQALIESCSLCWNAKFWVTGGKNSHFQNIQIFNSDLAQRIFWQRHRREIFWDLDGSLTETGTPKYIIPFKQHITGITGCTDYPEDKWDNSIICDMNQVEVRDVLINNPVPAVDFSGTDLKIFRLDSNTIDQKMQFSRPAEEFQAETMIGIWKSRDIIASYASPFVTGQTYNIHFKYGASDFKSAGIFASPYFKPEDKGIVLRFNYSANRETFDIFRNIGGKFVLQYDPIVAKPDPSTCDNGQWYNDRDNKLFFICLSGRNKTELEFIETEGVICREECATLGDVPTEDQFRKWSDPTTWITGKVPIEGDSPIIQGAYKVLLDVDPPGLQDLTILGQLIFDETRTVSTLRAHKIWVKTGKIIAGNATTPFPGKINIILEGNLEEDSLVIDDKIDAGNKVLAVTRGLELYGISPATVWTRLAAYADAGTTQITVIECTGWSVGDEIVLGPSGSDPEQKEKRTVSAITGNIITLDSALVYDHYGAPDATITKDGIGQLDMRAAVGHLTRNIKIIGEANDQGWGCRVLIYQFEDPTSDLGIPWRGYALLHGVEFENCGQYDTTRSGLDLRSLNSELIQTPSEVIGCSFHDSTGIQLTIHESQYITVENNVFFNGQKALVQINNSQYIKFKNNLMIYVSKRQLNSGGIANWAVFGNFNYIDDTPIIESMLEVSNNVGQGSQDTGFFFMATPCSQASQVSFFDNQCSSTVLACYGITQSRDSKCNYFKGLHAYHSAVGIEATMNTEETRADGLILVENGKGLVLKPATVSIQNNVMHVTNSYIAAVARLDCSKCYKESLKPQCQNTFGIQLGTISSTAFPPISAKPSTAYDTICTVQRVDCRVYINNVVFENFKMNYTEIPECGWNGVFRQHSEAHDMTGQHYLTHSPCNNCHFESRVQKLLNPSLNKLGLYGGCGSFVCTGQINILIEDQDGEFFGEIGQAIGNNTYFGPNVTYCSRQEEWNGYWCPGKHATILNFMSTAPDYNKRLYSPVQLTDGQFFNQINSYIEWSWAGSEPRNQRESKFVSLVSVNTTINMTNAGMNPTASDYWLSKRRLAGSPEDWVIVKLQFAVPQIIQLKVNSQVIQPGITKTNGHYDLSTMTNICGANNYFFENRTIHFVVTGEQGCKVSLSLKNTLQISTRLAITTAEFFGEKFLQYAVAQLGGDPYNYFILGTFKKTRRFLQETQEITVNWGIVDSAEIGTTNGQQSASRLEAVSDKLQNFNPVAVGRVIENSVQVQSIETLNYPSTEAKITDVPLNPGESSGSSQSSGSSSGSSDTNNNSNSNSNSNGNTNSGSNNGGNQSEPPLNPDDSVPYIPKNQEEDTKDLDNMNDTDDDETVNSVNSTGSSDSAILIIVVSVVASIIGVSLVTTACIYHRKVMTARIVSLKVEKFDNDFVCNHVTDDHMFRVPESKE